MNSDQEMSWTEESKKIDSLDVEVCFLLDESFYTGDPNSHEQLQSGNYLVALEQPSFKRVVPTMARTSEAYQHVDELSLYYKNIIEKSLSIGRPFNEIRQYFWLRLWLWNTEKNIHVSFPWYDSFSEMQRFFSWLQSTPEKLYTDIDQGWQVDAVLIERNIHIRQIDPDDSEEYANVSIPFEAFLREVNKVENRAKEIITKLSNQLGVDVWSNYLNDAKFGTEEWQPNKFKNKKSSTVSS